MGLDDSGPLAPVASRVPRLVDRALAELVDDFARHDAWCQLALPEALRDELLVGAREKALAIARLLVHARTVGLLGPVEEHAARSERDASVEGGTAANVGSTVSVDGAPGVEVAPATAAEAEVVPFVEPSPDAVTDPPEAPLVLAPVLLDAGVPSLAPPPAPDPAEERTTEPTLDRPPARPFVERRAVERPPSGDSLDQLLSKFKQGPDWSQPTPRRLHAPRGLREVLDAFGPPQPDETVDALLAEYKRKDEWAGLDDDAATTLAEALVARLRAIQAAGRADDRVDRCVRGIHAWARERIPNRYVRGLKRDHTPHLGSWLLDAQTYWRDLERRVTSVAEAAVSPRARPRRVVEAPTAPPENTLQVVESCARTSRNLLFLRSALESAQESPYRRPEEVRDALVALDEVAGRWAETLDTGGMGESWWDAFLRHGFEYKGRISETTRGNWAEDYTFVYEGEKVLFEEHITIGKKQADRCLSIHFHRDTKARRVVVGHVGRHLTNTFS
ncbi:MAG: hypothetical protein ACK4YP_06225 [Myxococcota bacterium]